MKIDKGVPIPKRISKSSMIRKLKKGESVVLDGTTQSAINIACNVFRAYGFVTCRKIDNNSVRVWRIK